MTRILIAEDSPTQAEQLRLILEAEGFEAEVAPNGQAALQRFAEAPFDMVISDIMMPGLSGYELCQQIKGDKKGRDVPVILLSTLNDPMDIISGLECEANNFITKPYERDQLLARIRTVLQNKALRSRSKLTVGIELVFLGKKFFITSEKEQILDLLIGTFEDIVRTNRALQESKAATEAANDELEAFSYSVAHDLRAPLRGIDGFSQALLEDYSEKLDEQGKTYLRNVRQSAQVMAQLIDSLLMLARVTQADVHRKQVDLSNLAIDTAGRLRSAQPERQVEFVIAEGAVNNGDSRLLGIVFENLLSNAWKFTGKREQACIEFGYTHENGQSVYFIRDNGAGFDMAYAAKLFGVFQRLHRVEEFEGTGIGLATVHRIIRRHGGRIWAVGEVDRGATFYFTLNETEHRPYANGASC
jgi:two-component system sensor histidine kinase/response regulator